MRYYHRNLGTKHFHKYYQLNDMASYPHSYVATDLIYFITHVEGLDWVPFRAADYFYNVPANELIPYQPHPLSFFSDYMKVATRKIMRHSVLDYKKIYDNLVKDKEEHKLGCFVDHFYEQMHKLFFGDILPSPEDIFHKLVYMGRLTSEFCKQGSRDVAHLAPHLLEQVIHDLKLYTGSSAFLMHLDRSAYDITYFIDNIYDGRGYTELVYEHNADFQKDSEAKSDLESEKKKKRNPPSEVSKSTTIVGPALIRARYRPGYANVHRICRFYKYI